MFQRVCRVNIRLRTVYMTGRVCRVNIRLRTVYMHDWRVCRVFSYKEYATEHSQNGRGFWANLSQMVDVSDVAGDLVCLESFLTYRFWA